MSSKAAQGAGGQIKDKWKLKKWFVIKAPKSFGEVVLGSTLAYSVEGTMNRKIETTLYDLTGDFNQVHVHLYFKVIGNEGDTLVTRFAGHELSRDYLRSIIRRKSSKVSHVIDVTTKDGYLLRVKGLALTTYRCHRGQKTAIRKVMEEIISKYASELTFDEFVNKMLFGELTNEIFDKAHRIYPLRKVEIEKSKVLKVPESPSA